MLVVVDPSISSSGVAVFEDGELSAAWLVRAKEWREMVHSITASVRSRFPAGWEDFELVIERPRIYTRKTKRYDDIMKMMLVVGGLGVAFRSSPLVFYFPQDWKKNLSKEAMVERVKDRLRESDEIDRVELVSKSLEHNVFDAVGIGLHHLKRLNKHRAKKWVRSGRQGSKKNRRLL